MLGGLAFGSAFVGREDWQRCAGDREALDKCVLFHLPAFQKPLSFALLPDFQAKHGSMTRVLELLVAESNGKWKLMSVLPDEKTEDAKRLSSLSDVASVARQIQTVADPSLKAGTFLRAR